MFDIAEETVSLLDFALSIWLTWQFSCEYILQLWWRTIVGYFKCFIYSSEGSPIPGNINWYCTQTIPFLCWYADISTQDLGIAEHCKASKRPAGNRQVFFTLQDKVKICNLYLLGLSLLLKIVSHVLWPRQSALICCCLPDCLL